MLSKLYLFIPALLAAQTVPTPESVLGHKPGDDFYLANYDESRDYFHKLAATSNRIKLINVGKTTRGLDWEIAIISSPQNLAKLDHYKDISRRLAYARGLSDNAANALAHEGKAIIHIDGGLHSTEVAGDVNSRFAFVGEGLRGIVAETAGVGEAAGDVLIMIELREVLGGGD